MILTIFFPLLKRHLHICGLQQLYQSSLYAQIKRFRKRFFFIMTKYQLEEKSFFVVWFLEFWVRSGDFFTKPVHIKTICSNIRLPIHVYNIHLLFIYLSKAETSVESQLVAYGWWSNIGTAWKFLGNLLTTIGHKPYASLYGI